MTRFPSSGAATRLGLRSSAGGGRVALALLLTTSALTLALSGTALADGGRGGGGDVNGDGTGVGGVGYAAQNGGKADNASWLHAGGGGGAAGTDVRGAGGLGGPGSAPANGVILDGMGGIGGDGGLNNKNGAGEGDGKDGVQGDVTNGDVPGGSGGGGGGGGAGFYYTTDIDLALAPGNLTYVLGSKGGNGGNGFALGGAGGWGGDGGGGAVMTAGHDIVVDIVSVTGGRGGDGGLGATKGPPPENGNGASGGGGDGGAGVVVSGGGDVTVESGIVEGGEGGSGGDARFAHARSSGGLGGDGGAGIDATGGGNIRIVNGDVQGGTGGGGGDVKPGVDSQTQAPVNTGAVAGAGGNGGVGINATNADSVTIGAGARVVGGVGNDAGAGDAPVSGLGGVGIVASNGTVVTVAGTVSGGRDATDLVQAKAISLLGGGNRLVLESGFELNGNVASDGTGDGDTLALGGTGDDSFDLAKIGTQFTGFEALGKTGSSIWTLTGSSDFSGPTTISAGTLDVDGSLAGSAFTVMSGGTLSGSGTVGATTVNSGGRIAPGGMGTLNVSGTLTLSAGSTYAVEVAPNGSSDKLAATGSATLAGTVVVTSASGANLFPSTPSQYTILSANGGITGSLGLDTKELAFFDGALDTTTTANSVTLTLTRNDTGLADVADNGNQKSTAGAIESLGPTDPLYAGILGLSSDEAQSAYQQLSGESLGAADAGQQQTAGLMSTAVADRVTEVLGALDGAEASGYAPATDSGPADPTHSIWISGYGARAKVDAGAENAASSTDTGGFTFGLDGEVGDWTVGFMGGYGRSDNTVAALGTRVGSADYSAGVYAGTEWDSVRAVLGAVFTASAFDSTRNITLPSAQTLTADYGGSTGSMFGEASKEFDFGVVSLTPYAGAQYLHSSGDGYAESGGSAALAVAARSSDAFTSTFGLRSSADFVVDGDMLLTLGAGAGWKHAFADDAVVTHSFVSGGNSFAVSNAEIPADRLAIEASAGLDVSSTLALDLGYTGEFTGSSQTSQLQAGIKGAF